VEDLSKKFPLFAVEQNPEILFTNPAGYNVSNGGYGSSMAVVPSDNSLSSKDVAQFYFMTDNGESNRC